MKSAGERFAGFVRFAIEPDNLHEPIGCRVRQRPQQHRVHDAEHRRIRAEPQGQGDQGGGGEAGAPDETPQGETQVIDEHAGLDGDDRARVVTPLSFSPVASLVILDAWTLPRGGRQTIQCRLGGLCARSPKRRSAARRVHCLRGRRRRYLARGRPMPRIVLVGEQPGDVEDREGHPFVGPAGALLDRALVDAGLDRASVYLTNAVKHFSGTPAPSEGRGKRRIHKKPRASEVKACRPWLMAEMAQVRPSVIVCLGTTAVQALLGPSDDDCRGARARLRHTVRARRRHPPSVIGPAHRPSAQPARRPSTSSSSDLKRAVRLAQGIAIGPARNSSSGPRRGMSASSPSTSSPIARTVIACASIVTSRKCGVSLHDTVCASANAIGPAAPQLARGARDEIVDAVDARVLEVVLVAAEHRRARRPRGSAPSAACMSVVL